MKISDRKDTLFIVMNQYQKVEGTKIPGERCATASAGPEEKVNISEKAREFTDIKNIINSLPDVKKEKIQKLQNMIDRGVYNVPAEELAKKIISENILDIFA